MFVKYSLCLTLQKVKLGAIKYGSGGIRTHAIEMTGALNQRLIPLGQATSLTDHCKVENKINGLIDLKVNDEENCNI